MSKSWTRVETDSKQDRQYYRLMRKKSKFLIDECLGGEVADIITQWKFKARYAADVGLIGHPDENYVAWAKRNDFILLSHNNKDFWNDRTFPPYSHAGIVLLPGGSGDHRVLLRSLWAVILHVAPFRGVYDRAKVKIDIDDRVGARYFTIKGIRWDGRRYEDRYVVDRHGALWKGSSIYATG